MNKENQIVPIVPAPGEAESTELKATVRWIIKVVLKVGVGYLTKVILEALGL
jgi:hypothetical protein